MYGTQQKGENMSSAQAPETRRQKASVSVDDQQVIDLAAELQSWTPTEVRSLLPLAKWSLESVTHLTEYEDEKANRILTAIAFLSALVGVAFAAIAQRFPLSMSEMLSNSGRQFAGALLMAVYFLFGFYFLLLTAGAVLTLWAVQPRFRLPGVWKHTKTTPASFLFFAKILEVSGKNWANAFTGASADQLELQYVKNSILETYLIAQKIPKKLRPLTAGVRFFIASTLVLIVLLPLCAIAVTCVGMAPSKATGSAASAPMVPGMQAPSGSANQTSQPQAATTSGNSLTDEPKGIVKKGARQPKSPEAQKQK